MNENKLLRALQSRKLWMALIGLVLILVTAWNQDPYPTDAVVTAIMGVVGAYVAATAWEDAAEKKAIGEIAARESTPTVSIDSNTVTVTTPDTPPTPTLDRMG